MLKNIKIGQRLMMAFSVLCGLLVMITWIGTSALNSLGDNLQDITTVHQVEARLANSMSNQRVREGSAIRSLMLQPSEEGRQQTMVLAKKFSDGGQQAQKDLVAMFDKYGSNDKEKELLKQIDSLSAAMAGPNQSAMDMAFAGKGVEVYLFYSKEVYPHYTKMQQALEDLASLEYQQADEQGTEARNIAKSKQTLMLVIGTLAVCLAAGMALTITRSIVKPANDAVIIANAIAAGDMSINVTPNGNDEMNQLLRALRKMQDNLRENISNIKVKADEMRLFKYALDNTTAGVMIADPEGMIVYANAAQIDTMTKGSSELSKLIPNFDPNSAVGSNFDRFHQRPGHQRNLLSGLKSTYRTTLNIGGLVYKLAATPVFDEAGKRLGTTVDWSDYTAEATMNKEVGVVIDAASMGDFSQRVPLASKEGYNKDRAESVNHLMQSLSASFGEVSQILTALAEGDLSNKMEGEYHGMFATLQTDVNATVDHLSDIIKQIKESTDSIDTAAKEISAGNTDLSQRTEQQASNLEKTASAMEELTATVKQNADNARQANQLAIGASDVAERGGRVVGEVVNTMSEINQSSKQIVDIISVIDGIAFQTNILALNAAVEAARAGEQGRGFAVVATEVRTLAQRSATAAKEIKELINNSVDKVTIGSKLVDEAGQTMGEVVSSVKRVTDIMSEITAASLEQSAGIEQVNDSITQMDEATQQNAALVEQAAAAAESLEEQALTLGQAVVVFKLSGMSGQNQRTAKPTQVERRGPNRATNVARIAKPATSAASTPVAPPKKEVAAKVSNGTAKSNDDWEEF